MGQHERSTGPEAKLRAVSQSCREGRSCPEAVFLAYRGELGFRGESARRLAKELPRTLGEPGLCEVFAAAFSILELLKNDGSGSGNGMAPGQSYRNTAACLRKEYGSWSCGELEGGGRSDPELCRMRMKDCVLLIETEREKQEEPMTELEKQKAGREYNFFDPEVTAQKEHALQLCRKFNAIDPTDYEEQLKVIKELFGSTGEDVYIQPEFNCDNGKNIHVGKDFLTNYNVTILDIAPVRIGDYCMIGPNTLIATVGHPLSPAGRRRKAAQAEPVQIGDDVWIGGNCTILPGVSIGNNVVVAAGSVVTKDVPDNCVVAGNPARLLKALEDDTEERRSER